MNRSNKIIRNLSSEIFPQIVIMILGVLKSKFFLDYLGENTVGLVNLFSQIVGYLSLVEGGIGQAVVYKLYNPTSKKNYKKVSEIKNGTIDIFKKIMLIIIILSFIVGLIIPFLIKNNQFDGIYILYNFVLYVVSEIILYTTIFERSIYIATEKSFKINRIIKTSLIIKHICEISLAIIFQNVTIIFGCLVFISIIENILIKTMTNREFTNLSLSDKKDKSVLKEVKDLIVHKVAGLVSSNIDIIIISKFIGLGKVLIYSTYLIYVNAVISLTNKISRALVGTVGNILVENKENAHKFFIKYNNIVFIITILVVGPFCLFINYFINLFYSGKVNTSIITAVLFALVLAYNIIRIPLITYTEGAGLFKKTKICPIIESIINLLLSLILVNIFGINGCLMGTIISLIISEYLIKPKIIYKEIFNCNSKEYYKNNICFICLLLFEIAICVILSNNVNITNFLMLIIYFLAYFIINTIINIIIFKLIKKDYILEMLRKLKR